MHFRSQSIYNRRQFLAGASALGMGAFLPSSLNAQLQHTADASTTYAQLASIPKDTRLKFNPDGTARGFAGNTVICHVLQQSRLQEAVAAFGNALRSSSFAPKLAVLPSDSYHVTILGGPNDQDRSTYGWPSDIPIDASIEECSRIIGTRFAQFKSNAELPIRFRLDKEKTLAPQRPSGLQLLPADAREAVKLRTLRDQMSDEVFRYRESNHDTFEFHISMAYQMKALTVAERREYQGLLEKHLDIIITSAPVMEFGVPEYCTFKDMNRFEVQALLRT